MQKLTTFETSEDYFPENIILDNNNNIVGYDPRLKKIREGFERVTSK